MSDPVIFLDQEPVYDEIVRAHGHYAHRVTVVRRMKDGQEDFQLSLNIGPMATADEAVELAKAMVASMHVMLDAMMPTKGNA